MLPSVCRREFLDNQDAWKHLSDDHGSLRLNYLGMVHQQLGRKFMGYTPIELLKIEAAFLRGCGFSLPLTSGANRPNNPKDKNVLFKGLSATVSMLCSLDGIDDVMDYSELFDFKNSRTCKELELSC